MSESTFPRQIDVIDSHTEGEPTRVVVSGWPELRGATMEERRDDLALRFDHLRRAVVAEPRGHGAIVGALLTPPVREASVAGVIFFDNGGYLGMCGHGLIGLTRTLESLGRLGPGSSQFDTPAGRVTATLEPGGAVTIENVPAFSHALDQSFEVPGLGRVGGDIAYGGNWFFLTRLDIPVEPASIDRLMQASRAILETIRERKIGGREAPIDHVEIFGPAQRSDADAKNFVLCPSGEFDRSPCGTGTSAKMAVLHARGELPAGKIWRQESITGSLFEGWLTETDGLLIPHIRGRAFVTSRASLRFDPNDPLRGGLGAS